MKITDIDLREMLEFVPDQGKVLLGEDRMLILRQDSLAMLRSLLYEQVGEGMARSLLARFGYRCGSGDFQTLTKAYEWDTERDSISAGPVLHAWEGIVHVEPMVLEWDRPSGHFHMTGIWRNSYEAAIHAREIGRGTEPVCHSLTGYASGWATAFFGKPLLAIERRCAGRGDEHCEFEIRPADAWGPEADPWKQALDATSFSLSRELEQKIALVQQQAEAIRELSTPVLEIWDSVLALPIVGVVDTRRSMEVMSNLLARIVETQAECVIIDVTGVEIVDTRTADYLLKVMRSAGLLGARCVLTGLSPSVAQTLVEIGADLTEIHTLRNLREGLKDCLRHLARTNGHGRSARR